MQNSVKAKNDSLYFRYRIQNKSDTVFVFYNVDIIGVALNFNGEIINPFQTNFIAFIYDKENNLPSTMWANTRHRTYEEDSIYYSYLNKYIVLKPGEAVEYDSKMLIGNYGLKKGMYKFQLKYFCSDYYKQKYARDRRKYNLLKNSFLFEGEAKSNECSFRLW